MLPCGRVLCPWKIHAYMPGEKAIRWDVWALGKLIRRGQVLRKSLKATADIHSPCPAAVRFSRQAPLRVGAIITAVLERMELRHTEVQYIGQVIVEWDMDPCPSVSSAQDIGHWALYPSSSCRHSKQSVKPIWGNTMLWGLLKATAGEGQNLQVFHVNNLMK